jgi:hypothetical protein
MPPGTLSGDLNGGLGFVQKPGPVHFQVQCPLKAGGRAA